MPKGVYERDPLDRDHVSTGISLGQETAKLEKEFQELKQRKKIRQELDRDYLKSEIYQSRDKIEKLKKENESLRYQNRILKKAMNIEGEFLQENRIGVCGQ